MIALHFQLSFTTRHNEAKSISVCSNNIKIRLLWLLFLYIFRLVCFNTLWIPFREGGKKSFTSNGSMICTERDWCQI